MPDADEIENVLGGRDRADLLVISAEIDDDDALALVQMSARFSPTTAVVVVRRGDMNGSLPSFMRAGVRDVVAEETGPDELSDALERALSWSSRLKSVRPESAADQTGLVVTIFSSKGGTGKTFLATNLAAAIAEKTGEDTALVDLDLAMGDVFSYWGTEPTRPIQDLIGLGHMVDREAILSVGSKLTDHLWGFGAPADPAAASVGDEAISTVLEALKNNFPYVVVDGPGGYSDQILPAFDQSDAVCLIAGLDVVGIKHLAKALETLGSIGVHNEKLLLVLNRADSKVGLDVDDVERVMNLKIDTMIPSSRLVPASLNKGKPLYIEDVDSGVSKSIGDLADKLIALRQPNALFGSASEPEEHKEKRSKFRSLLGRS
ncbi:MAG: P-loop NTPase [Actinobacteria bacterium]|nr:P-loop NTPase [Actinomycetota bacterium]